METLQGVVEQFTYLGIFAVLLLGSLGVPIPEEMAIIAAAVLSQERLARCWLALAGLLALLVVLGVGVWRWKRRLGTERLEAERTAERPLISSLNGRPC